MNSQYRPPQNRRPSAKRRKKSKSSVILARLVLFVAMVLIVLLIVGVTSLIARLITGDGGDIRETAGESESSADIASEHKTEPPTTDAETTGAPVTDAPDTTAPVTETPATAAPATEAPVTDAPVTPTEGYKTDISAFLKYIEPENRDEYLILINKKNPLDETHKPTDLTAVVDTRKDGRATQYMRESAEKALEAMLIEARACGIKDITITSAYRSYAYQTQLFNDRLNMYGHLSDDEAYAKASAVVAIPGTSEHQSGLCADMHNLSTGADVSFANTESGKWLAENSWKFGFILRFPKDKTEITEISFEPWHFRFVGRYHATQMYELGLCLEEYFEYLGK